MMWIVGKYNQQIGYRQASLDELMKGLIGASITNFLRSEGTCDTLSHSQVEQGMKDIEVAWHVFFDIVMQQCRAKKSTRLDRSAPLSMKVLNFSPEHPVCKAVMYIFAMDTFLPRAIQNTNN